MRWSAGADWIAASAVLALWLIARPYRGVRHDAILYLGQTLNRLMPDRFGSDLFFAFGSQDKYSLFSPMMAPLVARWGIGTTELCLMVVCHLTFMVACWKLTDGWFERPLRWAAMMLVAVLPHIYGGRGELGFTEPFLTARSFAEPLALFALWQLMKGRLGVAIAIAFGAVVFHPLIALPVLIIGWVMLIFQQRRWAWLGLLLAVPAVAGALGVGPFDVLWRRFDAGWFAAIRNPNQLVFVGGQGLLDLYPVLFDALVLGLLLRSDAVATSLKRLVQATLVVVVVLTTIWGLGADVFGDVFLTQIQLYRVYWPMHLLAILALPLVGVEYWTRGWVGRWCAAALATAAIAVMSNWDTGWLCIAWAVVALGVDHWKPAVPDSTARLAAVASFLAMAGISAKVAAVTYGAVVSSPDNFKDVSALLIVLGLPFVGSLMAVALLRLLARSRRAMAFAGVLVGAGLVFGVTMWDQRSSWQRHLEAANPAAPEAFASQMPAHAVVYWDGDLVTPWLLAGRPNYFSYSQGAGLLFNRDTAIEFARRSVAVRGLEVQRQLCATIQALTDDRAVPRSDCAPTADVVADVCQKADGLQFLVLQQRVTALPPLAEWHDQDAPAGPSRKSFYLYSCPKPR